MIVTPAEMRSIEEAAFASGVSAEPLMDQVGRQVAARCLEHAGRGRATVIVFAGRGNNGGDALVTARELLAQRALDGGAPLRVLVWLGSAAEALGELPRRKLAQLPPEISVATDYTALEQGASSASRMFVIDGLLGIGARGALRDPIRPATRFINRLRATRGAYVYAIDVPTGVDAGSGAAAEDAVVADETLAAGFAKTGLVADAATNFVGRLSVIDLPAFAPFAAIAPAIGRDCVIGPAGLAGLLPPRPHESNKGMYGRVGILAGSVGATGAAVMCSHACARAGAGLITLLVHPDIYEIVAAAAAPEVMVKPLESPLDAIGMGFDVLALGPGLGRQSASDVRALVEQWKGPMVVDADGLNVLAEDLGSLAKAAGPRLLTPHPGEMARLRNGDAKARGVELDETATRAEIVREFTQRYPVTLLLKGARTLVGADGQPLAYNGTGNAGMATGGMGDVLTGLCAGLAGQHLTLYDAARLGAWMHGRAADLAIRRRQSEQSLLATDLTHYFGAVFQELRDAAPG